jgi:hypothetical protein
MDIRIDVRRIIGSFAGNYDAYQLSTEPTDIPNNSIQIGKIPVELRCVYGSYVIWNEQVAALKAKSHLPQDVSVAMGAHQGI